jgi:NIMA (never in mitosis gene a)-related kinase 1/4/5
MDKYRKVKIVGKGSFGHAVLVQSVVDRKLYIMKIIDVSRMERKQKEEALNEVHVLKSMRHPYIVTYRESFMDKRCLCIVMDYADGGDMYGKIAKQKQSGKGFPESMIIDWFVQICLAIKHMHDRKILHRDLKTQNVFLTSKGEVKIGDFGISRVLQHTYDCAQTAIGTPYYLSPEICQEKPYNQKSDIWSLGCILYEMVTLRHAFDASSMKGLVVKILRGTYPSIPSCYSQSLKNLIDEMLEKDPKKRPSIKKILENPYLNTRISQLLSQTIAKHEFGKIFLPKELEEIKENIEESGQNLEISPKNKKKHVTVEEKADYEQVMVSLKKCLEENNSEDSDFEENSNQRVSSKFLTPEGIPLPGVSDSDSAFCRIEALRCYLETQLGFEKFMQAYNYLSLVSGQEPPEIDDENSELQEIIGPDHSKFIILIYQMIVCEDAYYKLNNV